MDKVTLGNRIRLAREQRGISQEDLAELISKTQYSISSYETGKRKIFANDLPTIAKALGVPVSYFFEDEPANEEDFLLTEFRNLPNEEVRQFAIRFMRDLRHTTENLK